MRWSRLPPSLRSSHSPSPVLSLYPSLLSLYPSPSVRGMQLCVWKRLFDAGGGTLVHSHFKRFNRSNHRLTPSSSAKLHWFNNPGTRKLLSAKDGKHRGLKLPPVGPIITSPDGIYNLEGPCMQKRKLQLQTTPTTTFYADEEKLRWLPGTKTGVSAFTEYVRSGGLLLKKIVLVEFKIAFSD